MPDPKTHPLSDLCCQKSPDPDQQKAALFKLISSGADLHEVDKNGVTPLHHAVRFRSPAAVEVLLENGADPNRQCRRSGSTPLHRAVTSTGAPGTSGRFQQSLQIVTLLLHHGADAAICNKSGRVPADYVKDERLKQLLDESLK